MLIYDSLAEGPSSEESGVQPTQEPNVEPSEETGVEPTQEIDVQPTQEMDAPSSTDFPLVTLIGKLMKFNYSRFGASHR